MSTPSPPHPGTLPVSALFAVWLDACLRGAERPGELTDVLARDRVHVVTGLSGGPLSPVLALGELRARGATGAALALPAPGDPVGLAGPPAFNVRALEADEAVLVVGAGVGLVPETAPEAVTWHVAPAERPRPLDWKEHAQALRIALERATRTLADLEVARWQPEIADVLSNLRHRRPAPLPPSLGAERAAVVERALLCREIVALARQVDAAGVSAYEIEARADALVPLERSARRALVAALSG